MCTCPWTLFLSFFFSLSTNSCLLSFHPVVNGWYLKNPCLHHYRNYCSSQSRIYSPFFCLWHADFILEILSHPVSVHVETWTELKVCSSILHISQHWLILLYFIATMIVHKKWIQGGLSYSLWLEILAHFWQIREDYIAGMGGTLLNHSQLQGKDRESNADQFLATFWTCKSFTAWNSKPVNL